MYSILKSATNLTVAMTRSHLRPMVIRTMSGAENKKLVEEIQEIIKDKIRPSIQEHGGDLEFVSYENKIVKVKLQGACSSCPSSIVTLKSGVKNMLQYYVPEVEDVEEVFDE